MLNTLLVFLLQASPRPDIMWLKDNVPVTKRVTISNSDGSSQLLIPSSERSDSGVYSILVKNLAGQETFSTEVRVTGKTNIPENGYFLHIFALISHLNCDFR